MKTIVVLSGVGMGAGSGLQTFRGDGGLREAHRVEDVITPPAGASECNVNDTPARRWPPAP